MPVQQRAPCRNAASTTACGDASVFEGLVQPGGIPITGLAEIVQSLGDVGSTTKKDLTEINRLRFNNMKHTFQLVSTDGEPLEWSILDPAKLLSCFLEESETFPRLYAAGWARKPPSVDDPWRLAIAFDEFVPGNKLSVDESRETMVCSFTFLELGQGALSRGVAWCPAITARAKFIEQASTLRYAQ